MSVMKFAFYLANNALMADAHNVLLAILSPMADAYFQLAIFASQEPANSVLLEHMKVL